MRCLIDAEEWKPVVGYEEWYEVSTHGRVASVERVEFYPSKFGRMFVRIRPYKVLKARIGRADYPAIGLHKNGKVKGHLVHRLVAQAFIPNPDNLPEVNHKDEIRHNNLVSNLEWVDRSGNVSYSAYKNRGSMNGTSLLSEEDVIEIVSLLGTVPQTEIGKLFDVSNHTIHKIKCGKNWSWLTGLGKEGSAGAMSN